MTAKILCVDDDPAILDGFSRNLRGDFAVSTEQSARAALTRMQQDSTFQVVLSDMQMPEMNGLEFLSTLQKDFPDTVRIMLTGNADLETATKAVNDGQVFRFLTKPCPPKRLIATIHSTVTQYRLQTAERDLLDRTLKGTIKLLMEVLASIDHSSFGLCERIRERIREYLGHYPHPNPFAIESAALLSQIGRVAIPPLVLVKKAEGRRLDASERDMLARIPRFGADLLGNIPRLEEVAEVLLYQKKNFDGSGFPFNTLSGNEVPLGARILRIFSDLCECENHGMNTSEALAHLRLKTGCYDPEIQNNVESMILHRIDPEDTPKPQTKACTLKELCPGQILAGHIKTRSGTLVASAGTVISRMILQKLANFHELEQIDPPILIQTQGE